MTIDLDELERLRAAGALVSGLPWRAEEGDGEPGTCLACGGAKSIAVYSGDGQTFATNVKACERCGGSGLEGKGGE